ncbi:hypothetical protein BKA62DRAFT_713123 [Auriculariales sp. MPI-PUGE-AT-0066]|nr:hypothetical protein BKA62DRAFT_713123 [Auriculariales sp. MPI-PUGE-AT-0066]
MTRLDSQLLYKAATAACKEFCDVSDNIPAARESLFSIHADLQVVCSRVAHDTFVNVAAPPSLVVLSSRALRLLASYLELPDRLNLAWTSVSIRDKLSNQRGIWNRVDVDLSRLKHPLCSADPGVALIDRVSLLVHPSEKRHMSIALQIHLNQGVGCHHINFFHRHFSTLSSLRLKLQNFWFEPEDWSQRWGAACNELSRPSHGLEKLLIVFLPPITGNNNLALPSQILDGEPAALRHLALCNIILDRTSQYPAYSMLSTFSYSSKLWTLLLTGGDLLHLLTIMPRLRKLRLDFQQFALEEMYRAPDSTLMTKIRHCTRDLAHVVLVGFNIGAESIFGLLSHLPSVNYSADYLVKPEIYDLAWRVWPRLERTGRDTSRIRSFSANTLSINLGYGQVETRISWSVSPEYISDLPMDIPPRGSYLFAERTLQLPRHLQCRLTTISLHEMRWDSFILFAMLDELTEIRILLSDYDEWDPLDPHCGLFVLTNSRGEHANKMPALNHILLAAPQKTDSMLSSAWGSSCRNGFTVSLVDISDFVRSLTKYETRLAQLTLAGLNSVADVELGDAFRMLYEAVDVVEFIPGSDSSASTLTEECGRLRKPDVNRTTDPFAEDYEDPSLSIGTSVPRSLDFTSMY